MDIRPIEMTREVREKVDYWAQRRDTYRAIAQFVESAGYAPVKQKVPVAIDVEALVKPRVEAGILAERTRLADDLRTRADGIELDLDDAGEPRKTNANKAMQTVKDTLHELANRLIA
jgi:hypothetical protein